MVIWSVSICVRKLLTLVQLTPLDISHTYVIQKLVKLHLTNYSYNLSVKELIMMRQFQFDGFNQAVFTQDMRTGIIKPLASYFKSMAFYLKLNEDPLLYNTPQTAGLRKMTLKYVPNDTSQLEIGH